MQTPVIVGDKECELCTTSNKVYIRGLDKVFGNEPITLQMLINHFEVKEDIKPFETINGNTHILRNGTKIMYCKDLFTVYKTKTEFIVIYKHKTEKFGEDVLLHDILNP